MKPELVQLTLDARPTDTLPNVVWTWEEMGDVSAVLRWERIGGGWRTTYADGTHSGALSTREILRYSTPSATPLNPRD